MMKKKSFVHTSSLIILGILFFFISCRKQLSTPNEELTLADLKSWYNANNISDRGDFDLMLTSDLDWENSVESLQDNNHVTEIAIQQPASLALKTTDSVNQHAILKLLLFNPINTKNISGAFMVISGDLSQNMKNVRYKSFNNFSGKIIYYDFDGNFLNGYIISKGAIVKALRQVALSTEKLFDLHQKIGIYSSGSKLMLTDANSDCTISTYEIQQQVCLNITAELTYKNTSRSKLMTGDGDCWWQTIGYIDVLSCTPESGGDSGGGISTGSGSSGVGSSSNGTTSATSAIKEVVNNLSDPCKKNALADITDTKVKNFLTGFYNNFLLPLNSSIKVTFNEQANLKVNNKLVPAYSTEVAENNWEINISTTYYSDSTYNMSKEAWGIIIAHEILHIFIDKNDLNTLGSQYDHAVMFKNFVEPTRNLLHDAFGISYDDALKLALTGMKDLWSFSDFAQLCSEKYGVSLRDIDTNFDKYTKGTGGTKCAN